MKKSRRVVVEIYCTISLSNDNTRISVTPHLPLQRSPSFFGEKKMRDIFVPLFSINNASAHAHTSLYQMSVRHINIVFVFN